MIVKRVDLGKLPNGEDAFDVVKKMDFKCHKKKL